MVAHSRHVSLLALAFATALALAGCKKDDPPAPAQPPAPPPTYTIGGTVTGLSGTVTLANNGGDARAVNASGTFTFATALSGGAAYAVTVTTQPSGQTCTVTSGSGSVAAANVTNVAVTCTNNTYTIGGTVQGLTGTVTLANGTDTRAVNANGTFTFATALLSGAVYNITVTTQPTGQTCIVTGGSGNVATANVSATVSCTTNPAGTTAILGKLGASWLHTCALRDGGTASCWGYNSSGQLGSGNYNNFSSPFIIPTLTNVTWIDAGYGASCLVYGAAGNVACSGDGQGNTFVNVSDGTGNFAGAQMVAVGDGHKCLVTTAGAPKCWGRGLEGQLGDGQMASSPTPVSVLGQPLPGCGPGPCATGTINSGVVQITAANNHSCILFTGGYLQCWGYTDGGATGFAATTTAADNVLNGVTFVDTGEFHTCAVMTDQTVKCWGSNSQGQLGLGSGAPTSVATPTTVPGLTGVVSVATGNGHTCALRTNGQVSCWGSTNTVDAHLSPFEYSLNAVIAIAAGFDYTCALRNNKTMQCWGSNSNGQLGNGNQVAINSGPNPNVGTVLGGAVFWGP
jgi:alpha-tubulin suppressor-like RCC1 family protein